MKYYTSLISSRNLLKRLLIHTHTYEIKHTHRDVESGVAIVSQKETHFSTYFAFQKNYNKHTHTSVAYTFKNTQVSTFRIRSCCMNVDLVK